MKIAVQKNHLGGQIWYRSLDPARKPTLRQFSFNAICFKVTSFKAISLKNVMIKVHEIQGKKIQKLHTWKKINIFFHPLF